jgi:hypothetical protein
MMYVEVLVDPNACNLQMVLRRCDTRPKLSDTRHPNTVLVLRSIVQ